MVDYKDRLAEAMKDAGVTTSTLASQLEVTYQAVDKVLKGNTKELTASNNSKAAQILNVNTDWLATGRGSKRRGEVHQAPQLGKPACYLSPAELADLVSLYAACNDKGRAIVMEEVRAAAVRYGAATDINEKREAG